MLALVAILLGVLLPRLNDQVEAANKALATALSRQVDDFLRGSAAELERVAAELAVPPSAAADTTRIIIDTQASAHAPLEALYVLDASARVFDVGLPPQRRDGRTDLLGLDFSARSFFRSTQAGTVIWSSSYLSQRGKIVVAVTVPIGNEATTDERQRWTLLGELDLEQLSRHIGELGLSAAVLPIIVDSLGQIVAHPDASHAARQDNLRHLPLVRAGLAGQFGTARFSLDGVEQIGTVTPVGTSGWLTLVAQPTAVAFATIRSTLLAIAGGVAAALALAVLCAYVYGRTLVRRVADFASHVQAIADGDYRAPLPSSRAAELANLAVSMRRMANAILEREAALSASEEHYRALFSSAPLPYQSVDVARRELVEVNDAWLSLLGYRRDEVIGHSIMAFVAEPSIAAVSESFRKFVADGRIDGFVFDALHKNGTTITLLVNGQVHQGVGGQARTHCILTDITERLRIDEARQRSAALLAQQAERALAMLDLPKAAERMDESGFIEHGLAVAERLTESRLSFLYFVEADQQTGESVTWSRAARADKPSADAAPLCAIRLADLWAMAMRQRAPLVFNEQPAALTSALPTPLSGIQRLISVPVVEGGRGRMMLGVANKAGPYSEYEVETARLLSQDIWRIVNQRRAEQAQRLAATVFSASTSAICITDAEQRIVSANPALTMITGYALDEIVGQTPRLFSAGLDSDGAGQEMWTRIAAHGLWRGEVWNRRKNGEVFPASLTITAVRNGDGVVTHYTGSFDDISERKRSEEHIRFLAHHDALTRLPNRTLLEDRIRQAIAKSRRDGKHTAVLFLDLDRFKLINDTLGHDTGDRLLARVADRLKEVLRETETVARLGGDEFIIVIPGLTEIEQIGRAHV